MKKFRFLFALVCAATTASVSWAAVIAISNSQDLAFGKFVAGSGGSVIVSAAGVRSAGGGVVLASGAGTVARFVVSGDPNSTYAITLPGNGTVSLTSGANTMALNTFTSDPSGAGGVLGGAGTQTLSVGATLTVGGNQAAGNYSGSFDVTVNYN